MIKAIEIWRDYQADPKHCLSTLSEALNNGLQGRPGGIRPNEFSLTDLAAHFITVDREPIGYDGLRAWIQGGRLLESAVSSSAFAAITQRIIQAAVLEGAQLPGMVLSNVVPTIQARKRELHLPVLTLPMQDGKDFVYDEGQDKPVVALYAEYVKSLPVIKNGGLIPITREAILFDETDQILDAARRIGERIALEKERKLVRFLTGCVSNCVIERRRTDSGEVTSSLFLTSGRWVNSQTNALADWTDIDDAENLILGNTLPTTGHPPVLTRRHLLAPPQLRSVVARILNATEVKSSTSSGGVTREVISASPVADLGIQMLVSPLVWSEQVAAGVSSATAAGTWFYGDLVQAARYYQLWPLEVQEHRDDLALARADILVAFSASEAGVPVIVEPRVWTRNLPS